MAIDVTEATFASDVVERSRTLPVVVDFWAGWCAPCRSLGPVLEAAADAREGEVVLAKVDVDANPELARRFGVRGIPAVKAFRDGRVVSEFTGAQPRVAVERFLDALVPSPAERLVERGDRESLRQAVELDPGSVPARVALARLLLAEGDTAAAVGMLEPVEHDAVAAALLAQTRLAQQPDPPAAVAVALDALRQDDLRAALPALVEAVRQGHGETRDLARRIAVGLFLELGEDSALTQTYRPQLAAALY